MVRYQELHSPALVESAFGFNQTPKRKRRASGEARRIVSKLFRLEVD
jgi:hypothetical protein